MFCLWHRNSPMRPKRHREGLQALNPNSAVSVTHHGMSMYDSQVPARSSHFVFIYDLTDKAAMALGKEMIM